MSKYRQSLTSKLLYRVAPIWGLPLSAFRPGNVVMFHMGRCGSSVLADLLYQHPKIYWGGEIYSPFIRYWREQKQKNHSHSATITLKPDPLKLLQRDMLVAGSKYYGCEVKFHHLVEGKIDIGDYTEYLRDKNFSFIVLARKNFLRSILSNAIMFSSSKTKSHNRSDEKARLTRVAIDVERARYNGYEKPLIEHLRLYQKNFESLEKLLSTQNVLQLTYEDDISNDPRDSYRKVCEFLGVTYKELPIRLSKTNPFQLSDILINYEEIKSYLGETEFAWMCE